MHCGLKRFEFYSQNHRKFDSVCFCLNFIAQFEHFLRPSVFERFISNEFGETIRNSTITLLEQSLHLEISISKITQCPVSLLLMLVI